MYSNKLIKNEIKVKLSKIKYILSKRMHCSIYFVYYLNCVRRKRCMGKKASCFAVF